LYYDGLASQTMGAQWGHCYSSTVGGPLTSILDNFNRRHTTCDP